MGWECGGGHAAPPDPPSTLEGDGWLGTCLADEKTEAGEGGGPGDGGWAPLTASFLTSTTSSLALGQWNGEKWGLGPSEPPTFPLGSLGQVR